MFVILFCFALPCHPETPTAVVRQVGNRGGDEQLRPWREEEHEPARRHRRPADLDRKGEEAFSAYGEGGGGSG